MPDGQQRLLFTVTDASIYIYIFVVCVDRAVYNFQNLSITIVEGLAVTMWACVCMCMLVLVFTFLG